MRKLHILISMLGLLVLVGCAGRSAQLNVLNDNRPELVYEGAIIVMDKTNNIIIADTMVPELGLAQGENRYSIIDDQFILVNDRQVLYQTKAGDLVNLNNGKVATINETNIKN